MFKTFVSLLSGHASYFHKHFALVLTSPIHTLKHRNVLRWRPRIMVL